MEEEALSARLTTQEKLLLSQAVYKLGALDWDKISGLLANHPVLEGRPAEWFDTKSCEAYYVGLMTEIGINVPAQDASRPQAKVHLRLAQHFYLARLQELKSSIAEYEQKFTTLMAEIAAIKSGSMDKSIKDEIRAGLARKFGKKLLDSWVPDEEAVKEAIAAGPPSEAELKQVSAPSEPALPPAVAAAEPAPEAEEVVEKDQEYPEDKEKEAQGDVEMEEVTATNTEPTEPAPAGTPAEPTKEVEEPPAPSSPASELSSAPDDSNKPATPVKPSASAAAEAEAEDETTAAASTSTRTSKRKASTQPRGGQPASKRSVRRKTSATPATPAPADADGAKDEPVAADNKPAEEGDDQAEDATMGEPEPPVIKEPTPGPDPEAEAEAGPSVPERPAEVEEEEAPVTRGRRGAKRESIATGSRAKRGTSPASSPSKHMSPPPSARRAASASSAKSGTSTPAPTEERRSSRRAQPKGRGMRDEVVSKSVREQSAAVESVKEEEDGADAEAEAEAEGPQEEAQEQEPERPPTRSSRRGGVKEDSAPNVPDLSAPLPDQRKGTRRSSTRGGGGGAAPDEDKPVVADEDESEDKEKEKEKEKKQAKRPRHSSPRETKAAQRMLNNLLDQIAGHRNGNVFAQPVKKSDAPDYAEIIKRPMDIKTIRSRIRDGHITTIEEFERDAMLIFANATMFNPKGSAIHDMALDMMKDAEQHIQHLKDVQKRIAR